MNTSTTRLYVLVRKELGDGQLVAHFGHAAREAYFAEPVTNALAPAPSEDEVISVLRATKKQINDVADGLKALGIPAKKCVEVKGVWAGSTPSMGFAVFEDQRHLVEPLVKDLKPWIPPAAAVEQDRREALELLATLRDPVVNDYDKILDRLVTLLS